MKAEHRKELQTNALADALGRGVRTIRSGPTFSWFKVGLLAAAVLAVLIVIWVMNIRNRAKAEAWALVEYNDINSIKTLVTDYQGTKQALAGRFAFEFGVLWDGIRQLGSSDVEVVKNGFSQVTHAAETFEKLMPDCGEDNNFLAEAKYHCAVAYEAIAVVDLKFLEEAKKRFEELATKDDFKETSYGRMAKLRVDQYNTDFTAILAFYTEYRLRSRVSALPPP